MIPINDLLFVFIVIFLTKSFIQFWLYRLNLTYLRRYGQSVPDMFQDSIDSEKLKKMTAYTIDTSRLNRKATLTSQVVLLVILLSGFLPWLAGRIHFLSFGVILKGLIFFALLSLITGLFRLPFDLYETFRIEARYGFNTIRFKTWLTDLAKNIILSALLGSVILGLLLALIAYGGERWWIGAWILVGGFELLLLWLFPVLILPLFNKIEPIEDKALEEQIRVLVGKIGLRTKGVFKMDASKRSKHTNAFFTGIGRTKRIILFDTLLTSHTQEEILAVLAHETGHWKKKHTLRLLISLELVSLISFYLVAKLLNGPWLYQTFGFSEPAIYAGIFLAGILISLAGFFIQPLEAAFSRRYEREADTFAVKLMGTADPMCSALKRMAVDNLANLSPHPFYAWFYYSHPPLIERIHRLRNLESGGQSVKGGE